MNYKDKEAFEKWELDVEWSTAFTGHRLAAIDAWQAACEYKDNEFKFQTSPSVIVYQDMNEKLQAENKKLREALNRISEIGYYHDYGTHRDIAIEALKEVEEK